MTQTIGLIFLAVFAVLMIVIGVVSSGKSKTLDGFLLGGRNIGAWMSAFAYGTSYFSAVLFIGYAGKNGWDIGFASMWIGVGNALLGCLLAWKLLAGRVRRMTHRLKTRTMPEFFEARFNSTAMKLVAAAIIFVFLVPYAASVYKGLGVFFGAMFPSSDSLISGVSGETLCMFIVALLTGIYLILGGYVAVAITDFVQGLIMIVGVIVLAIAVTVHPDVGGFSNAVASIKAATDEAGNSLNLTSIFGGKNWSFLLSNIILTSIGTFGLPQMVHKFYAVKNDQAVKQGAVISTVFALIIGCGAYYVGTLARLVLGNKLPEGGYDAIMPEMLIKAFSDSIAGSVLLSVILLLLLSASMSTLSSVVLSSASAITIDFFKVIAPKLQQSTTILLTRIMCLVFVAFSFLFATFKFAIIVSIMSYSWGIVAGSFIGPFMWGLLSKKITKAAAWCGMAAGFLTMILQTIIATSGNYTDGVTLYTAFQLASKSSPQFGVVSMLVSFLIVPIVSLFTKKFDSKHVENCFAEAID